VGDPIGLIKFFPNEEYLDQFINGLIYCNTPEYYRMCGMEGVGDLHESCNHAYRKERGDAKPTMKINDIELKDPAAVTIKNGGQKDMWLHCWALLEMPEGDDELRSLTDDFNRLRSECGSNFAFLPHDNLGQFVERLRGIQEGDFGALRVAYSGKWGDWGVDCKSSDYKYQREYRFLFGECGDDEQEPLQRHYEHGFSDLIHKTPELRIEREGGGPVLFHLGADPCYCEPESSRSDER
jgi:hypothetical protein